MFRRLLSLTLLVVGGSLSLPTAQCLGPDGLTGPCWVTTPANLPVLQPFELPGLNICWTNCDPQEQPNLMQLQPPQRIKCGHYTAILDTFDAAGTHILTGALTLDYTRTWLEISSGPTPRRLQVYRFLAKVDMKQVDPNADPCLVPNCIATWETAFYHGYVDYAFDCATGRMENVITLFHNCDYYIHQQGVSSKPGAFHRGRSFALVAPHTAANPFVPAIRNAQAGPILAEAMRGVLPNPGDPCIFEDPVRQGDLRFLGAGCACPFMPVPPQVSARRVTGFATCRNPLGQSSWFRSLKVYPNLPWYELMSTSLGTWTTDATYPGREHVWADEGAFIVKDFCSQVFGGASGWGEVYYGASTADGWFVEEWPETMLTQFFTDLAANHSFPLPGPPTFPMVGDVKPTRNLIYVNVP